jgi:hypothetical protein
MLGELITLPLRLSARAASLALRGAEGAVNQATTIAGRVIGAAGRDSTERPAPDSTERPTPDSTERPVPESRRDPRAPASAATTATEPAASAAQASAPEAATAPEIPDIPPPPAEDPYAETPPEPAHVSEEPSLVEAFAEPGAEDGAGAEITVEEPWPGYRELSAQDVIDRVEAAGSAELAAVSLYESLHQHRKTVLEAVERKLDRLAANSGSSD